MADRESVESGWPQETSPSQLPVSETMEHGTHCIMPTLLPTPMREGKGGKGPLAQPSPCAQPRVIVVSRLLFGLPTAFLLHALFFRTALQRGINGVASGVELR